MNSKKFDDYYQSILLANLAGVFFAEINNKLERIPDDDKFNGIGGTQFTDTIAQEVVDRYEFVEQFIPENYGGEDLGFSAVLLRDKEDGGFEIAIRGSQRDSVENAINDWGRTNFNDIRLRGMAVRQAVQMYNWYTALITPTGVPVTQISFRTVEQRTRPIGPNIIGSYLQRPAVTVAPEWDIIEYDLESQVVGKGAITNMNVDVHGWSLGGHMAHILARMDTDRVKTAVAFNSPGFDTEVVGGKGNVDQFFDLISTVQQNGVSPNIGSNFPDDRLYSIVNKADVLGKPVGFRFARESVTEPEYLPIYSDIKNLSKSPLKNQRGQGGFVKYKSYCVCL